jgi:hypothetical protein
MLSERPVVETSDWTAEAADLHVVRHLLSFPAETEIFVDRPPQVGRDGNRRRFAVFIAIGVVALAVIGIIGLQMLRQPAPGATTPGSVTFTSEPAGATVVIDAFDRGVTPLQLSLPAGKHSVEVAVGGSRRSLSINVNAASTMAQHVEFAAASSAAVTGRLDIVTEPPGARVDIDGSPFGVTPLTVPSLAAGQHKLTLSKDRASLVRLVTIAPAATATVIATMTTAPLPGGWAQVDSSIELDMYEEGQLIGTTRARRLLLPAGQHDVELVNTALEFRARLRLKIEEGKTSSTTVRVPNGSISVNALPWAEVSIDGHSFGTTPVGNLPIPIGNHDVVLRHPQFGERTQRVLVPVRTPVRLGVDLTK